MGRKLQGANLRAKKRAKVASEQNLEKIAEQVETGHVTSKSDEQLFVLDTTAASVPGGVEKEETKAKKRKNKELSEHEQQKVQALLKQYDAKALKKMVHESKTVVKRAQRVKKTVGNVQPKFDLWGSDDKSTKPKKQSVGPSPGIGDALAGTAPAHVFTKQRAAGKLKKKTLAVDVAHGGQSYHPDAEQHQDMIGEALALELRRKEVKEYNSKPISQGMSESTKALLVGSDDEEESDEDEDADSDVDMDATVPKKKKEKMTTAQRNKQKRHRALEKEIDERKRAKKLLNSVVELKRYQKLLTKKEKEDAERKIEVDQLKAESERTLGQSVLQNLSQRDPVGVPTLPVALSSELQSSLRSMKPKGSLLEDRFESFRDRTMADKKHVGDRKRVVQGKRRRVKVKGNSQYKEGNDFVLMG